MKVAIYLMTHDAVRAGYDKAAGMVLRGISEDRYVYCTKWTIPSPVMAKSEVCEDVRWRFVGHSARTGSEAIDD